MALPKAFENAMIKQQIRVKVLATNAHAVLAGNKGKAFA